MPGAVVCGSDEVSFAGFKNKAVGIDTAVIGFPGFHVLEIGANSGGDDLSDLTVLAIDTLAKVFASGFLRFTQGGEKIFRETDKSPAVGDFKSDVINRGILEILMKGFHAFLSDSDKIAFAGLDRKVIKREAKDMTFPAAGKPVNFNSGDSVVVKRFKNFFGGIPSRVGIAHGAKRTRTGLVFGLRFKGLGSMKPNETESEKKSSEKNTGEKGTGSFHFWLI